MTFSACTGLERRVGARPGARASLLTGGGLGALLAVRGLQGTADLEIIGDELHVRMDALSAPRRSRAIAGLCAELTATETLYSGTKLRLVFSVKGY